MPFMQDPVKRPATHFRAWLLAGANVAIVLSLSSCVSIPRSTRDQSNRFFGNGGATQSTMVGRAGSATFLATATYVSGAKPYHPATMRSLDCGNRQTPVTVLWSSADGVADENARLACQLVTMTLAWESQATRRPIPALGYRLLLVPKGYSLYRHAFSMRLFGPAHLTYAVHGGDAKLLRTELVQTIAHETMHVWAEFFHVPAARRAGTREEQMAYLTEACAELALTGTLNPRNSVIVTPGLVKTTQSIDRSQRGGITLHHELAGYFSSSPTLQRDSPSGREFAAMCRSRLGDFFAP